MPPPMAIVKCSSAAADLSRTRVLKTLMETPGFRAADVWELCVWRRTLTLTVKKKEVTKEYVRTLSLPRSHVRCDHHSEESLDGHCGCVHVV